MSRPTSRLARARRSAFRMLLLAWLILGALAAAVVLYRLPDWLLIPVFVAGFLIGGMVAGRVLQVMFAAVTKGAEPAPTPRSQVAR